MTDETLQIRLATPNDMDEVMKVAVMACEDNGFLDFRVDLLAKEIWPSLHQDKSMFAVIGPNNKDIQGFVLLKIGTLFYSTQPCLEEKCLWVHPDFRSARGGRAKRLLDFTKQTADSLQLPLIIGIFSDKRSEGKAALYRRFFGEPAGAFFLYNAKCGNHSMEAT